MTFLPEESVKVGGPDWGRRDGSVCVKGTRVRDRTLAERTYAGGKDGALLGTRAEGALEASVRAGSLRLCRRLSTEPKGPALTNAFGNDLNQGGSWVW